MTKPIISVIMPLYNVGELVRKSIKSVLNQTFTDWELIIVNDGSTDNSREIAINEIKGERRIRLVDKPNGGLSDARNFGLQLVNGDYIHFFDSDDWISPNYYELLYKDLLTTHADIILSGYTIDCIDKRGVCIEGVKKLPHDFSTPQKLANFISGYFNFAWNKLFKRDFLINNKLQFEYGLKLIEDCEFMSRVVEKRPIVTYSQAIGYHYRNDSRKTLSRYFDKALIFNNCRRVKCSTKILDFLTSRTSLKLIALDIIKFNCIRSLVHSLFAFTRDISFKEKRHIVEDILKNPKLQLQHSPSYSVSNVDRMLRSLIVGHHYTILSVLYQIKER